jgi:predicted PurR-regulated permease PerM
MKNQTLNIKFDIYNLIAVLGVGAVGYAFWAVRGFLLMLVVALVLSTFIEDFVKRWEKYRIPRVLSVLIFYIIMFTLFFGAILFLVPVIIKEVGSLATLYPEISQYIKLDYLSQQFNGISNFGDAIDTIKNTPFNKLFSGLGSFFGGVVNLVIVFVVSFYLSIQDHSIDRILRIFTPKEYEPSVIKVWHNTQRKIGGWFRGQLIIAVLLFIVTYIGLSIIDIPYALLLSLLAGLFGLVPYGILIALLPALGIGFIYGGLRTFFIIGIFYGLVQQFLDYLIQPLIFKRMVGIPSLLVILSVIIGAKLFGLAGLIIAIPVALFGLEIIAEIEYHKDRNASLFDEKYK